MKQHLVRYVLSFAVLLLLLGHSAKFYQIDLINRLDAIISFAPLSEEIIMRVTDKFLIQLETQLHEKKVEANFTEKLRKYLAKHGFDPLMGARPMERLIQDTIRSALADELLFGRLVNGGKVTVDIDENGKAVLLFEQETAVV